MNLTKKLSLIAITALLFASCKNTAKDGSIETPADSTATDTTDAKETAANLETASFKIDGMMCPQGCAATIEKKLAKMDGVEKASVDFEKKTATINFDPAKQTAESFVQTVEKMGEYKVSDVKSSGDKAYYVPQQEPAKKAVTKKAASTTAAAKGKKEAKPHTCPTGEKKGGCCSAGAKKEDKGGKM
jgi:mercuric ion binding protein